MTELTAPLNDRMSGPYTATAAQVEFAYDFPITDEAELRVVRRRAGVETVLELGVDADDEHYTVQGVGEQAGGTITLGAGATENDVVAIFGETSPARTSNFQPPPNSPSSTNFNADLNRLTMVLQELTTLLGRMPRLADTDAAADLTLPIASVRASMLLGFDSNGDLALYPAPEE